VRYEGKWATMGASNLVNPDLMRRLLADTDTDTDTSAVHLRRALMRLPPAERDAWLDRVFAIDGWPEDGPDLPPGCVPYLPGPVEILTTMVDEAGVGTGDVFVDIGSGLGRAALLTHFLTGASAIGVEVQSHLVRAARALARDLNASRVSTVEGDALELVGLLPTGTVFFLYCPFSGQRLERFLDALEPLARVRPIRVCCVQLPALSRPWLSLVSRPTEELAIYRSTSGNAPSSFANE